jgi:outer membrane protein OmpA-like peptidoglycan-associated protein
MNFKIFFSFVCGLLLALAAGSVARAQVANTQAPNPATTYRSVPSGSKMKFDGVVIDRNADTFTIRDRTRTDYQVRITDNTSVKTYGGFLKGGKKYPVTDLMRGLIVEVEGQGDAQGELVADKIRFRESDMRAAVTSDTRVTPVEENQKKIAGQIDELYAVAQEARQQVAVVNERVSALDDYDVEESIAVTFRVNSAVLSPEDKQQLDAFAAKALASNGYMVEVSGHTDSTGGDAKNMRLSRERAESVVEYLTVAHKIPARRFITPMGYGKSDAVADNSTAAGRAQNRRVEVKILANRGLRGNTSGSAKTTTARP